jgi:hypothetical protein
VPSEGRLVLIDMTTAVTFVTPRCFRRRHDDSGMDEKEREERERVEKEKLMSDALGERVA